MSLTTLNMQDFAGNLKSLVTDRPLLKPWFQVNLQEFVEVHAILIYRSVSKSAVFLSLTSVNKYSRIGHPHNVTTHSVTIYVILLPSPIGRHIQNIILHFQFLRKNSNKFCN